MPRAREGLTFALLFALAGCRSEPVPSIHVVLGPAASDEATFTPRAALAELIEVSPSETTLLVHLPSSERTCDAVAPASVEEVAVALRLTLPAGVKLVPGRFPRPPAVEGTAPLVTTVKLRGRKHELRPGGELSLSRIDASPQGVLEGLLKLEFAGDAEQPATRVSGRFLAHFCKINRLR
ncbi:MAG: hypothetical protein K0R38_3454 [Polyangiaceae bacterium]|nr:hypothetical protein [Polyangiaceae bacterium]